MYATVDDGRQFVAPVQYDLALAAETLQSYLMARDPRASRALSFTTSGVLSGSVVVMDQIAAVSDFLDVRADLRDGVHANQRRVRRNA